MEATQESRGGDVNGAGDADPAIAHSERCLFPHAFRDPGLH